jgi:hypothetical protein
MFGTTFMRLQVSCIAMVVLIVGFLGSISWKMWQWRSSRDQRFYSKLPLVTASDLVQPLIYEPCAQADVSFDLDAKL